jgi:hypothetical protein
LFSIIFRNETRCSSLRLALIRRFAPPSPVGGRCPTGRMRAGAARREVRGGRRVFPTTHHRKLTTQPRCNTFPPCATPSQSKKLQQAFLPSCRICLAASPQVVMCHIACQEGQKHLPGMPQPKLLDIGLPLLFQTGNAITRYCHAPQICSGRPTPCRLLLSRKQHVLRLVVIEDHFVF